MIFAGKAKLPRKGKAETAGGADETAELPFRIEMWSDGKFERLLALAAQSTLARAIYLAAITEHPDRGIVLMRGAKVIARSTE